MTSGSFHWSCSASSNPIVFLPSMRYGSFSVDASYQPYSRQGGFTTPPAPPRAPGAPDPLAHDRLRRRVRHDDDDANARARSVGCPRGAGVACGRERDRAHAELERARDADRGPARLERPGREQALVLHAQARDVELLPDPMGVEERSVRLAERDDVGRIIDREELAVSP